METDQLSALLDHTLAQLKALLLLGVANSTPIFARNLLGERFGQPLDGGMRFIDGRPLFGASKTIRGLITSLIATTLAAALLGFAWTTGALVALFAMLGDLASSFTKRRLGMASSSMALGIDQVPESLLPLLVCRAHLGLTAADIAVVVAVFFVLELTLSRLLFKLGIRDRPY